RKEDSAHPSRPSRPNPSRNQTPPPSPALLPRGRWVLTLRADRAGRRNLPSAPPLSNHETITSVAAVHPTGTTACFPAKRLLCLRPKGVRHGQPGGRVLPKLGHGGSHPRAPKGGQRLHHAADHQHPAPEPQIDPRVRRATRLLAGSQSDQE